MAHSTAITSSVPGCKRRSAQYRRTPLATSLRSLAAPRAVGIAGARSTSVRCWRERPNAHGMSCAARASEPRAEILDGWNLSGRMTPASKMESGCVPSATPSEILSRLPPTASHCNGRSGSLERSSGCGTRPWSWRSTQQVSGAEIFVQIRPVNSESAPGDAPIGALRRGSVEQSREPRERHRNRTPVEEIDAQHVLVHADVTYTLSSSWPRSSHAMPPALYSDAPTPITRSDAIPGRQTRDCMQVSRAEATFSPTDHLDQHVLAAARSVRNITTRISTVASLE